MKKIIFSNIKGSYRTTLLNVDLFVDIFQEFWLQISPGKIQKSYI